MKGDGKFWNNLNLYIHLHIPRHAIYIYCTTLLRLVFELTKINVKQSRAVF